MPDESDMTQTDLRQRLADLDAQILELLVQRTEVARDLGQMDLPPEAGGYPYRPALDADHLRRLVEDQPNDLPLVSLEHLWSEILVLPRLGVNPPPVYLDDAEDPIGMTELARFNFGFGLPLETCSDASDVVAAVRAEPDGVGIILLRERADLPWWRGLIERDAEIVKRLPFFVQENRPADIPALVIAGAGSWSESQDTTVYDARWSDRLPGDLMGEGIEILSFHRSASGVDALLAVSSDLLETEVMTACVSAGAAPDILRRVGSYSAPIDIEGDEDFDALPIEG